MDTDNVIELGKVEVDNKLTDWANEPSLRDLKNDYKEAMTDHHSHATQVRQWRDNYDGKRKFSVKAGRSKVVPKLIRKQAEWRYAALSEPFLSTEDLFNVEPVTWEDKKRAEQNKMVLNYQFNQRINKVDFIDDYVRTAVDEGTVVVKVGWAAEEDMVTEQEPTFDFLPVQDPEQAEQMMLQEQTVHLLMRQNPGRFNALPYQAKRAHALFMQTGIPHIARQSGTRTVTRKKMVKNHPTLEVCPYNKVILDPTCEGDMNKAQFVIYEFDTTLSELRKDGRYKNLDAVRVKESNILNESDDVVSGVTSEQTSFTFQDDPRKKIRVREYWGYYDIDEDGKVEPFVAAWAGDVKIRMEKNPFPDKKLPFIKVKYLPVTRENYGQPDGYLLEDNQDIIGAVTRGMIDMMGRSAAGQQGVRKDALDTANFRRFEQGEDYKFNSNVDPKQAFHMGQFPEIPQSAMTMIQMQNFEAESITGVKAFSQGITGSALGDTATGARGALDASSKREVGILRRLANGLTEIGRKVIAMNAVFLEEEEVIRITNEDFVTVRRDDLAGRFDVKLSISTAEDDNQKAQELAFMLQTVGPNSDPGEVRIIRAEIARLRKMPALAKRIEEYEPQPDPLQQERAQLENMLLKAQIADLHAKAEENTVDVGLKTAKTATEEAKARQMHSKSDQQDLDFLEQREGVKHDRDIDKIDAQAEHAIDQAVIKGEYDAEKQAQTEQNKQVEAVMKNFNL